MNNSTKLLLTFVLACIVQISYAGRYALTYCDNPEYTCQRVESGDTWLSLFPDDNERELVQRVNRMNTQIYPGMIIAVPKNLETVTAMELSPFPEHMKGDGEKFIYVDPNKNAWGAYDASGNLVQWGPAAAGRDWCPDIGRGCHTVTGTFRIYSKEGIDCFSTKFPVGKGGAPMPYCMYFHGGYALHGSPEVMGYNASHGCVRIFFDDAEWLNENFVDTGSHGTRVIILPYGGSYRSYGRSELNNPEEWEDAYGQNQDGKEPLRYYDNAQTGSGQGSAELRNSDNSIPVF